MVMNVDGSQAFPVANDGVDYNPVWSPDGTKLAYTSNGNMFERFVDQDDPRLEILGRENYQSPNSWSPDGQFLAFMELSPTGWTIWIMPRDGDPELLLDSSFNSGGPRFAPQGGWMAYVSDESGQQEVYVRPYPGSDRGTLVSRGGGREPVWSLDGRELYYRNGDRMMAVEITTEPNLEIGEIVELWEAPYFSQHLFGVTEYDMAPDGRFLMLGLHGGDDAPPSNITVVLDWFSEIEEQMRGNN